jgi:hypothetical protein
LQPTRSKKGVRDAIWIARTDSLVRRKGTRAVTAEDFIITHEHAASRNETTTPLINALM